IFNDFYYNPAVAAAHNDVVNLRAIYRNQWAGLEGKPHTQTFTGFGRLKKVPVGLGGNIFRDQTGHLRNIGFSVSAAYAIDINDESSISAGISVGFLRAQLGNDINIREQGDDAVLAAQQGKISPDAG